MGKEIIDALYEKDVAGAKGAARERLASEDSREEALKQFYLYAAHHMEKRFPTPHAVIYADALADLLKLYGVEESAFLTDSAVEYLCSIDVAPFESRSMVAAQGKSSGPCHFEYIEAAVRIGDKARAISLANRFLNSDNNHKELLEGFVRIASSHETPLGHTKILTNSARKGAEFLGAEEAPEMVCHLAGYLASRRPIAAARYGEAEFLDFKSAYAKVSLNIGLLGHHVIYLGHALQSFERATGAVVRENILNVMSRKLAQKQPATDESCVPNRRGLDGGLEDLLASIIKGDQETAIGIAARLVERGESAKAIFRQIVRGTCEKAPSDQSHYLIFANALMRAVDYLGPDAGRPFTIHAIKNACDKDYFLSRTWS